MGMGIRGVNKMDGWNMIMEDENQTNVERRRDVGKDAGAGICVIKAARCGRMVENKLDSFMRKCEKGTATAAFTRAIR